VCFLLEAHNADGLQDVFVTVCAVHTGHDFKELQLTLFAVTDSWSRSVEALFTSDDPCVQMSCTIPPVYDPLPGQIV